MCFEKIVEKFRKMTYIDIKIMKVCIIAFAFLIAKLWPVVLSLDWGWYAGVFAVTYAYLVYFFFFKK